MCVLRTIGFLILGIVLKVGQVREYLCIWRHQVNTAEDWYDLFQRLVWLLSLEDM